MFTPYDAVAFGAGAVFALFASLFGPKNLDGGNWLLGFAAATSTVYLVLMAYGVGWNKPLLETLMGSNSVPLCGALLYAAIMNFRTAPGILPLWGAIRDHCDNLVVKIQKAHRKALGRNDEPPENA